MMPDDRMRIAAVLFLKTRIRSVPALAIVSFYDEDYPEKYTRESAKIKQPMNVNPSIKTAAISPSERGRSVGSRYAEDR